MFRNLLYVALRNLNRFRFFTIINLAGLTLGITIFLIIVMFVRFELSYDTFNEHAERIYRVDWNLKFGENSAHNAAVTPPMAEAFVRDYPEVEAAARLRYSGASHFKRDIENTVEWRITYADNDLFRIFTIPFISGDPATALLEPNTVVITRSCATQFFGDEDPLGKMLVQDNTTLLKITGVVEDIPANSHFHYRMFLSMQGLEEARNGNWIGGPYNTYLLLKPNTDAKALESKLGAIVENYVLPQAAALFGSAFLEEFKKTGNSLTLELRPLLDIHLYSHLRNELEGNGDIRYMYLLTGVAVFILALACINFVNLATARSARRAREVGIRKVLGSDRKKIALQFFAESMLLSVTASLIAIPVAQLLLPFFNSITGTSLSISVTDGTVYIVLLSTSLFVGISSGLYPAIVLSGYKPVKVLKGNFKDESSSVRLRTGLVIFQFALSTSLIIITFALNKQIKFIHEKELGFSKEQVILMHDVDNVPDKLAAFKDEVLRNSMIIDGTMSSYFPGPGSARKTPLLWRYGADPSPANSLNMETWFVDHDYIPTLGIQVVQGRNFSRDFPSDSMAVVLNETAARQFGFEKDAIGQRICHFVENADGSQDRSRTVVWTVIGVVKNFNFESLREGVEPLGLFFGKSQSFLAFRFKSQNAGEVVGTLKGLWKRTAPGEPFHYSFLDEKFNQFYKTDEKMRDLFGAFSVFAIFIACLGLFALTAFITEQRTKEICIRKVLGASTGDIISTLTGKFSLLVIIGVVVAVPLASLGIEWYLSEYTYKVAVGVSLFIYAGGAALLLSILTISYHVFEAARNNPADVLKSE